MTTISVVIHAYNAESTILSTVDSVRQQTFTDIEIIVIDDGSSDRTLDLLETVRDKRLQVYPYGNSGVSIARNRGIAHSLGQYISFIDADDLWTKDKLEKQLAVLQANPQAGVVYSWVTLMLEAKNLSETTTFVSGSKATFTGDILSELLLENFIVNGSNVMIKREVIESVGEFDPHLKTCEDWEYYLRLAAKYHFALVPEQQIIYRKAPGSLSSKTSAMEQEGLKAIDKIYRIIPRQLQERKNKSIAKFSIYCGKIYLDRNNLKISDRDVREATKRFWKAIYLDPSLLLMKDIYIFLVKILFKQLLPHQLSDRLISTIRKPLSIKHLR